MAEDTNEISGAHPEQAMLPIVLVSVSIGHNEVSMHLYGGEDEDGNPQPVCDAGRNNAKYIRVLRTDAEKQNTAYCKSCYKVATTTEGYNNERPASLLETCPDCGEVYCRTRRPQHLIKCNQRDKVEPDQSISPDSGVS